MSNSPKSAPRTTAAATTAAVAERQLRIMFDSVLLGTMKAPEHAKVVARLANLLMQAAGVATQEHADDER
jgi:hypothetical protein